MPTPSPGSEVAAPSASDAALAEASSRALARHVGNGSLRIQVKDGAGDDELILPPAAARLLLGILTEMGRGNAVSVTPIPAADRAETLARRRAALDELTALSQELGLYDGPMR